MVVWGNVPDSNQGDFRRWHAVDIFIVHAGIEVNQGVPESNGLAVYDNWPQVKVKNTGK